MIILFHLSHGFASLNLNVNYFHWPNDTIQIPADPIENEVRGVKFLWGYMYSFSGPLQTRSFEKVVYKYKDTFILWGITLDTNLKSIPIRQEIGIICDYTPQTTRAHVDHEECEPSIISNVTPVRKGIISDVWQVPSDAKNGKYYLKIFYLNVKVYEVNFSIDSVVPREKYDSNFTNKNGK